jgi:LacI family transcriptional regulator
MARTTLADVAATAGVTVPTVSKVLNGRTDVSRATRTRVLELLAEGGYERRRRPAASAESDVVGPGLVELVMDGVEGSWATRVLGGVEHAAAEAGCDVVVLSTRGRRAGLDWVDRLVTRGSAGAVLVLVDPTPRERERLAAAGVAIVVLDPGVAPPQGLPSVGTTNWAGGYAAVEHLVGLGHERVAAIGGRADQLNSAARLDGHRSALAAAGLPVRPGWVRHADWTRTGARAAAADLLAGEDRPTSIFACSDRMACGVYDAAAERGLRVPHDLSVVGFDDLPESRWLTPRLTTVHQPVREMAAEAVRLLLRRERSGGRVELSTSLVLRDSTAAPRAP